MQLASPAFRDGATVRAMVRTVAWCCRRHLLFVRKWGSDRLFDRGVSMLVR
jgi:hypothetical protein